MRPQDSAFSGSCACFPQVQLKNPDGTGLLPGSACSKIFPSQPAPFSASGGVLEGQESAERLEKSVGGSAHQFGARGLQVGRHRGSSQEPGRSDPRGDGSLEGQRFGCGQIHLPQGRHGGFIRFCMDIQWLHLCHIIYYVSQSFIIDFNVCRYAMAWHNRNPMPLRFLRIGSSPSFLHLFLR